MSKPSHNQQVVLSGVASATLAHRATSHLLGYDKVYHGTDNAAAASIRKSGLKKSYAGKGVGGVDISLGRASNKEVAGKVYTSKNRVTADNHRPTIGRSKLGTIVTARVPHRGKERLGEDVVFKRMVNGTDNHTHYSPLRRRMANAEMEQLRIYKHSIPSRFIEGSANHGGIKQFASKGHMRRYLASAGGRARFAKGVAMAAGSGASGLYAIASALKNKH